MTLRKTTGFFFQPGIKQLISSMYVNLGCAPGTTRRLARRPYLIFVRVEARNVGWLVAGGGGQCTGAFRPLGETYWKAAKPPIPAVSIDILQQTKIR